MEEIIEYYTEIISSFGLVPDRYLAQGHHAIVFSIVHRESALIKLSRLDAHTPLTVRLVAPYQDRIRHIERENEILQRIKVDGVPKRIDFYEIKLNWRSLFRNILTGDGFSRTKIVGLVKEYIEGRELNKEEKVGENLKKALEKIVNDLHSQGIADLDLSREDIIIASSGKPYLIDLGTARFYEEVSNKEFREYTLSDLRKLETLCA